MRAIVEQDGPWFIAHCPDVPGVEGQGLTQEECLADLRDAIVSGGARFSLQDDFSQR